MIGLPNSAIAIEITPLVPQIEALFETQDGEKIEAVCKRWEKKTPSLGMTKSHAEAQGSVSRKILDGANHKVLTMPLSVIGREDLDIICERLGITPEMCL